ncbi:hypothetical protein Tco_0775484 [Tanacetum coccineum]
MLTLRAPRGPEIVGCIEKVRRPIEPVDIRTTVNDRTTSDLPILHYTRPGSLPVRNKMGDADINTLTMEQYLALTHENQAPSVVKPKIRGNVNLEIKSQFMRVLREDTLLGNKNYDAYEHVEMVLDIVTLFNILGVTHDPVMLCWDSRFDETK